MPRGVYVRSESTLGKLRANNARYQQERKESSLAVFICGYCKKKFRARAKLNRMFCNNSCKTKKQFEKPENHPKWRGEDGNTTATHRWVNKLKGGRPTVCEWCKARPLPAKDGRSRIEWANLSHEYRRDLDDWAALCQSCHRRYDFDRSADRERSQNGQFKPFRQYFKAQLKP